MKNKNLHPCVDHSLHHPVFIYISSGFLDCQRDSAVAFHGDALRVARTRQLSDGPFVDQVQSAVEALLMNRDIDLYFEPHTFPGRDLYHD